MLIHWLVSSLAIMITAYILPGVHVSGFFVALVVALVLGLINGIIKPIVIILTLPINILTLGIFTFVINAAMILLTSWLVSGFTVRGFWWALLFGLILSLVRYILEEVTRESV